MKYIKLETHKILKELMTVKTSSYIILIAFVSSFNLWYLTLEFLKPDFLEIHGLITTLQVTFALAMTWFVISAITTPKLIILNLFIMFGKDFDLEIENEKDEEDFNKAVNKSILANTLISLSTFMFFAYIIDLSFIWLITISFGYHLLLFVIVDLILRIVLGQEVTEKPQPTQFYEPDLTKSFEELNEALEEVEKSEN